MLQLFHRICPYDLCFALLCTFFIAESYMLDTCQSCYLRWMASVQQRSSRMTNQCLTGNDCKSRRDLVGFCVTSLDIFMPTSMEKADMKLKTPSIKTASELENTNVAIPTVAITRYATKIFFIAFASILDMFILLKN